MAAKSLTELTRQEEQIRQDLASRHLELDQREQGSRNRESNGLMKL